MSSGDLVPAGASDSDLRGEVNRRTHRAGYTDRDGQRMARREIVSRAFSEQGRENYCRIFGHG